MRPSLRCLLLGLAACGGGDDGDGAPADPDAGMTAGPDAAPSAGCGRAATAGVSEQTITAAGLERTYLRVVPGGYDPDRRYPLIFAWHGRTGSSSLARLYFGIEDETGDDAILVYPQGLPVTADPGDTGWELDEAGRDVALFDAVLAAVREELCVGRVYAMGHSFGGYMSNALACFRGGQGDGDVRAIASIAGGGPFGGCGGDPLSAVIIHGTADAVVPYAQGEGSRDTWRAAAGCGGGSSSIDPSPCVSYDGCDAPLSVRWCSHDDAANAGHGWPAFAAPAAWQLFQASP